MWSADFAANAETCRHSWFHEEKVSKMGFFDSCILLNQLDEMKETGRPGHGLEIRRLAPL